MNLDDKDLVYDAIGVNKKDVDEDSDGIDMSLLRSLEDPNDDCKPSQVKIKRV